jgi:short-subunit dehydrogenase
VAVVVPSHSSCVINNIRSWPSAGQSLLTHPFGTIEKETGAPIDAIIFVAGSAVFGRTLAIPLERARETLELNFWACTSAARAGAEYWCARNRSGKFIAILSIAARQAIPFEAYYSASKAATARFLECLQFEYDHRGIEFICAYPGALRTPFRSRSEWYGLIPRNCSQGMDVRKPAQAVLNLLAGRRKAEVIGWRERAIDLAGRLVRGLYNRAVLQRRAKKLCYPAPTS